MRCPQLFNIFWWKAPLSLMSEFAEKVGKNYSEICILKSFLNTIACRAKASPREGFENPFSDSRLYPLAHKRH